MIIGLTLAQFTALHVGVSLIGIVAGLIAMLSLAARRWLPRTHAFFLVATLATSLTGFLFPFGGFTPALGVGIVSMVDLALAVVALYGLGLRHRWATVYALTAVIALWLNLFVFAAQAFLKIPLLIALAPTGTEPPFLTAQALLLVTVIILGRATLRAVKSTLGGTSPAGAGSIRR